MLMEAKSAGGLGEVRRIYIIYFISYMGRIEHPHLIRVHHLNRKGVYLRDVKRWLADLRGKDMPQGYAWSYKRRYKTGYVWQDVVDDELITSFSDNEYVLKGSQITAPHFDRKASKNKDKPTIELEQNKEAENIFEDKVHFEKNPDFKTREITEESNELSSDKSTLTEEFDAMKLEQQEENNYWLITQKKKQVQEQRDKFDSILSCFHLNSPLLPNKKKSTNDHIGKEMTDTQASASSESSLSSKSTNKRKSKSYSSGASNVFRNFITCRGLDTNDSVLVTSNCSHKSSIDTNKEQPNGTKDDKVGGLDIRKVETFRVSARVFGSCCDPQLQQIQIKRRSVDGGYDSSKKQQKSEFRDQKIVSAAYKPVGEPKCSQCRKPFKPEKMHSHMKSCRGIKALTQTTGSFC